LYKYQIVLQVIVFFDYIMLYSSTYKLLVCTISLTSLQYYFKEQQFKTTLQPWLFIYF